MGLLRGPTERLLVLESSAPHFSFGCKSWAFTARAQRLWTAEKRLEGRPDRLFPAGKPNHPQSFIDSIAEARLAT